MNSRIRNTALLMLIIAAAGLMVLAAISPWPGTALPVAGSGDAGTAAADKPAGTPEPGQAVAGIPSQDPQRPSGLVSRGSNPRLPDTLPASLRGTSVPDGWARTDRLGNLIPTPQLRQLFEYFLSALGEESLAQLVARIESALRVLAEPARSQARAVLGDYLDYKLAVSELEQAYGETPVMDPAEVQRRMAEIHGLRRTWMDAATVEAFFAADEAMDRFQLEQRRIRANGQLSATQKQEALRQAEQALPPALREAREQTRRFTRYEQMQQELAGDPEALQAWREQAFGVAAAERLAEVEQARKAWDRRWQVYARERDRLNASGLAPPELEDALERLRSRHFSKTEQVRARALDSIQ